jgi:hypothetical protein
LETDRQGVEETVHLKATVVRSKKGAEGAITCGRKSSGTVTWDMVDLALVPWDLRARLVLCHLRGGAEDEVEVPGQRNILDN